MSDAESNKIVPAKKRSPWRWVLRVVLVLVLGVVVVVAFLPGILSGGWGKGRITAAINNSIAGSVKIDSLSLAWFSRQKITGLTLSDPQGKAVASVESVSVDASLWSLMFGGRDLGDVAIVKPVLDVQADEQGTTDLQKAVEPARPTPKHPEPDAGPIALPVTFNLVLTDGKITAAKPGLDPVVFDGLTVNVSATDVAEKGVTFDLRTTTKQGALSGNVTVAGKVSGFNAAGELDPDQAAIDGTADVTDLPVDGIDTLAGLGGLLTAAIGDRLDLKLVTQPGEAAQTVTATAKSAHLNVDLEASVADGKANANGSIKFNATPAFVTKLAGDSKTTLADAVLVNVAIESLRAPIGAFDPSAVAAKIKASIADGSITQPGKLGQLTWQNTSATIDSADLAKLLTVKATSDFTHSARQGQVIVDADLSNLFSAAGKPQPDKTAVDADVRVTNLPTLLVDTLTGTDGMLLDAIGEWMNITAISVSEGAEKISITANVTSPQLNANLPLLVTDRITLKPGEQGTVTLDVAPALLARYLTELDYSVAVGQPVSVTIEQLNAPRPAEGEPFVQPADTTLRATAALRDVTVSDPAGAKSPIGPVSIPSATVVVVGDKLDKPTVTADLRVASTGGLVQQYVSRNMSAKLTANTTLDDKLKTGPIKVVFEGRSLLRDGRDPLQSADLSGTLAGDFATFTLDQPGKVRYIVTDAVLAAEPGAATLAEPMPVDLTIDSLTTPVSGFALSGVKTKLSAAIAKAVLAGNEQIAGTTMTALNANVALDGPANTLAVKADAKTQLPNEPKAGGLNVTADLANWLDADARPDIAKATGKVTAKISDLPAAFVDALAKQDGLITEAVGESVNVDLVYNAAANAPRTIALDAKSPQLTASGAFSVVENQPLTATKPLTLDWQMKPAVYRKLTADKDNPDAPPAVELTRPVRVSAVMSKLVLPPLEYFTAAENEKPALDPAKLSAVGKVTLSQVAIKHVESGSVASADELALNIDGQTLAEVKTTAAGAFKFVDAKAPDQTATGKLDAKATLADLFAKEGMSIDADVQLLELPVAFIDAAQDLDGMALAALGERLNMRLVTKIKQGNGPLAVALRSNNTKADLVGKLENQSFMLTQPLIAEMQVTAALGEKVLYKINPIFEGAKTADKPLRLTVLEKDLFIPLADFNIADLKVPVAYLELGAMNPETKQYELGAIKLDTGNVLGGLVRLAQKFGALGGRSSKEMTLKFTPIVVKLEKGRIDYLRRLDVLLDDSLHVASWGFVKLDTTPDDNVDQSRIRTYIGIPGRTLDGAFGLDGAPDDEMFVIPVKGTTAKPEADFGAAIADMGALQVQYRLLRDQPALAALARNTIKKLMQKEGVQPAPEPSVSPLPWTVQRKQPNKQPADQQQPKQDPPKEQPKKDEKSLEEKLLEEGLKQIFR